MLRNVMCFSRPQLRHEKLLYLVVHVSGHEPFVYGVARTLINPIETELQETLELRGVVGAATSFNLLSQLTCMQQKFLVYFTARLISSASDFQPCLPSVE